jgi:hypothetical protein
MGRTTGSAAGGPFSLIDAAATVSASNVSANSGLVAITLVNRSPEEPETAEVLLRDYSFDGPARIRTVTAAMTRDARTLPDVETAQLEVGSENTKDGVVAVRLPPRSFTVIEAAMTTTPARAAAVAGGESAEASILLGSAPNGAARLDPRVAVQPGGRITFFLDPARLYFFDPDTGQAITR